MPSSWSIKLAGTCRPASSCRQTSPSLRCRQNAPSSIRSKMSGSSCATTGSRTESSNPTTISSTIAATLGTSWSISPGASCPLDCANGRTGSDQGELVSIATPVTAPKGGQFVLHAKALHGNPYDGHTLGPVIADLEKLTG